MTGWPSPCRQRGGAGVASRLDSAVKDKLVSESGANRDQRPRFQPSTEQYTAHLGAINVLTSLYGQVTPIGGKLSLFGALNLRYDVYAMAGFGLMNITNGWSDYRGEKTAMAICTTPAQTPDPNTCDPLNGGIRPAFMWGVGVHVFFSWWLALNLELRDFVASTNMGGLDVNGDRALNADDASVSNNLFAGTGLSFFLPPEPKFSY
jgi:outer membrane beta-barrel protein